MSQSKIKRGGLMQLLRMVFGARFSERRTDTSPERKCIIDSSEQERLIAEAKIRNIMGEFNGEKDWMLSIVDRGEPENGN